MIMIMIVINSNKRETLQNYKKVIDNMIHGINNDLQMHVCSALYGLLVVNSYVLFHKVGVSF